MKSRPEVTPIFSRLLAAILSRRAASGQRYLEFLRAPTLSAGVYHLKAGEPDPQGPHARDEVYYVLSGRASIRVADEVQPVEAGSPDASGLRRGWSTSSWTLPRTWTCWCSSRVRRSSRRSC